MSRQNIQQGIYYNYSTQDDVRRKRSRWALFVIGGLLLLVALIIVFLPIIREATDVNSENEEPYIEWAGPNSPLAGVQVLTKNGLSYEEYADFYKKATEFFKTNYPDYVYVEYVDDSFSLTSDSTEDSEARDCVVDEDTKQNADEEGFWSCNDDELATWYFVFDLRSDTGEEFRVELEPDDSSAKVSMKLFDSNGQKLL